MLLPCLRHIPLSHPSAEPQHFGLWGLPLALALYHLAPEWDTSETSVLAVRSFSWRCLRAPNAKLGQRNQLQLEVTFFLS